MRALTVLVLSWLASPAPGLVAVSPAPPSPNPSPPADKGAVCCACGNAATGTTAAILPTRDVQLVNASDPSHGPQVFVSRILSKPWLELIWKRSACTKRLQPTAVGTGGLDSDQRSHREALYRQGVTIADFGVFVRHFVRAGICKSLSRSELC